MLCVCVYIMVQALMVDVCRSLAKNGFEGGIDPVWNLTQLTYLYDLSHVVCTWCRVL
jgi:hypothetical protein